MVLQASASIPESTAKEWISCGYIQAIAAQAGLNISTWKWDDGVDMEVGSSKLIDGVEFRNLRIALQIKSTAAWDVSGGMIAYHLKKSNYDYLRAKAWPRPYLVLYTLPKSRSRWITYHNNHVKFESQAYYLDLQGHPEMKDRRGRPSKGRTVRVPVENKLTAVSLLQLYHKVVEETRAWKPPHV